MKSRNTVIISILAIALGAYLLGTGAFMYFSGRGEAVSNVVPFANSAPSIAFDCEPFGEIDLKTAKCHLVMTDDKGLDFTTYRMTVKEIGRTFDMPVEGVLVGREYDTYLNFSWLADNITLTSGGKITVEFSIADDDGQKTVFEKSLLLNTWRNAPTVQQ